MSVTAALVRELRQRTGAGMMECKKALVQTQGQLEPAIELLRKKGAASAEKKTSRIAAEGVIAERVSIDGKVGVLIEVNCETDFVARDESFGAFAAKLADVVISNRPETPEKLLEISLDSGESVEDLRQDLVSRIGENVIVRRFNILETVAGRISSYLHGNRIGVLVAMKNGDGQLGRDLAMHVAAINPIGIDESTIPEETVRQERDIYLAQAVESGKPDKIAEKMVDGRMKKFFREHTLLGQPFVKDPNITVDELLRSEEAEVTAIVRYERGEGLERCSDDFVGEVLAQASGN